MTVDMLVMFIIGAAAIAVADRHEERINRRKREQA